jgi:hypothetical protein
MELKMLGRSKVVDPVALAEKELGALMARRTKLAAALDHANRRLEEELSARRKQLVESDDDVGGQVRTAVAQLRDDVDGVTDALAQVDQRIAAAEARRAAERQRIERETASKELTAHTDDLATAIERFATAGAALLAAVRSVSPRVEHSAASPEWTSAMIESMLFASRALVDQGRVQSTRVAAGNVEILQPTVPRPEPTPVPPIERTEVFSLARLRWCEGETVKSCEKYAFVHLPIAAAERAVARNVADRRGSQRARHLVEVHGALNAPFGGSEFLFDGAVDLDAPELAAAG